MTMDGILLYALSQELSHVLKKARIDKVYDINKNKILIKIRQNRKNYRLIISTHALDGAIYFSDESPETPMKPSLFSMVLRKHLNGATILSLQTHGMDRILFVNVEARNDLGDLCQKQLVLELMGKHSNLILLDEHQVIIDAIRKYNHLISRHREVLPGRDYVYPPPSDKHNLMNYDLDKLAEDLLVLSDDFPSADQALIHLFEGFSLRTIRDLLDSESLNKLDLTNYGQLDFQRMAQTLEAFRTRLNVKATPVFLTRKRGRPNNISLFPSGKSDNQSFESISEAIDAYMQETQDQQEIQLETTKLAKSIRQRLKKQQKKLDIHTKNIERADQTDIFRIKGELLTANLHNVRPGMTSIVVDNYYDPAYEKIEIELDPALSPSMNASRYFKRVSKIRQAAKKSRELILSVKRDHDYLESLLYNVDQAETPADVEDILTEVRQVGYVPKQNRPSKKKEVSEPRRFISKEGHTIIVGKNNKQNDLITKKAHDQDLWFHAKQIPGSHVILSLNNDKPTDQEILEAATLAAYYSKAKESSKVAVDYVIKKELRKPNHAKPGMVIYNTNKTILVDPNDVKNATMKE